MNVRNEKQAQIDIIPNCHRYYDPFSCHVTSLLGNVEMGLKSDRHRP